MIGGDPLVVAVVGGLLSAEGMGEVTEGGGGGG